MVFKEKTKKPAVLEPTGSKHHFKARSSVAIPRGELWLGADVFRKASLDNDLSGHLALVRRLGQDVLCLPLSEKTSPNSSQEYRYFDVAGLRRALEMRDLFTVAVIDGPFQRLVERLGLYEILREWRQNKVKIKKVYEKERGRVDRLLRSALKHSVKAVVIAEDLAGETSTFVSPRDIKELLSPFYKESTEEIHKRDALALFHSCGCIKTIVPDLLLWGFDGFAALQDRLNHLAQLMHRYGPRITLMGGIEPELLEPDHISPLDLKKYKNLLGSLRQYDGFILSSSCGLSAGHFPERIEELYRIADQTALIETTP